MYGTVTISKEQRFYLFSCVIVQSTAVHAFSSAVSLSSPNVRLHNTVRTMTINQGLKLKPLTSGRQALRLLIIWINPSKMDTCNTRHSITYLIFYTQRTWALHSFYS